MRCRLMNPGGFSLIEVIFTSSLLLFLMIVMLSVFPGSLMAIDHAEHRIEASHIAQSVLEKKRSGPFSEVDDDPDPGEVRGSGGVLYTLHYSTLAVSGAEASLLKKAVITITWEFKGKNYSLTQELYVCNISQ
ncbi:MAG: hypothetical protein RDV48_24735 [Candidatus Eremiobacteraeota bacterium]|nr:hypothetical protein [Candidatus Eremiobacteraeota bacterium]